MNGLITVSQIIFCFICKHVHSITMPMPEVGQVRRCQGLGKFQNKIAPVRQPKMSINPFNAKVKNPS